MAGVKSEAGGIPSQTHPQGAAAKGEAGGIVPKPGFQGVAAKGEAGQLSAVSLSGPAKTMVTATANITLSTGVSVSAEVIRAPFSPIGIAEHIAKDPEFYRRLALFVASELAHEAAKYTGQGNTEQTIRGELVALEEGFSDVAKQIASKAYDKAAQAVISMRAGLVTFSENHPQLVANIESLGAICLSTYVLGTLGVPMVLSALISASVVKGEKLSDLIKAWKHGK